MCPLFRGEDLRSPAWHAERGLRRRFSVDAAFVKRHVARDETQRSDLYIGTDGDADAERRSEPDGDAVGRVQGHFLCEAALDRVRNTWPPPLITTSSPLSSTLWSLTRKLFTYRRRVTRAPFRCRLAVQMRAPRNSGPANWPSVGGVTMWSGQSRSASRMLAFGSGRQRTSRAAAADANLEATAKNARDGTTGKLRATPFANGLAVVDATSVATVEAMCARGALARARSDRGACVLLGPGVAIGRRW